jgi:heparosan-N-sulfate-glucuronate 5-epimerase
MGISLYNIKRWTKMLTGKSIYHVEQNIGKVFKPGELAGYFNDMTQKVLQGNNNLENGIPFLEHSDGTHVQMPTMIFQYGLGAYDLWLLEGKDEYFDKAKRCADWALEHQEVTGAWNNFFYIYPGHPYSAMPQGEGASLLLRMYKETGKNKFLNAARRALDFMLLDIKDGGVSRYENGLILLEYTHLPVVMNGWIFALFGLYDFNIVTGEKQDELNKTIKTLATKLHEYDCGYWSLYDEYGKIASPFYHNLHIAQMEALYRITNKNIFKKYYDKFSNYQNNWLYSKRAFLMKVMQKIREK